MPKPSSTTKAATEENPICGIVMPIAGSAPYEAHHWSEVRIILDRAIKRAGMTPQPVWEGGATDIIHDRIVRNLFENPVIVCDVSGLNPNVMLELGMRLSFGKAAILITDDILSVPFDTKMIDHLPYPRDLHLIQTEKFIDDLTAKIEQVNEAVSDGKYRPFIKNFGSIEAGTLGDKLDRTEVILSRLDSLDSEVRRLRKAPSAIYPDLKSLNALSATGSLYAYRLTLRLRDVGELSRAVAAIRAVVRTASISGGGDTIEVLLPADTLWKPAESAILERLRALGIDAELVSAGIVP